MKRQGVKFKLDRLSKNSGKIFWIALSLSLFLHSLSYVNLTPYSALPKKQNLSKPKSFVRMRLAPLKKNEKPPKEKETIADKKADPKNKKILETEQRETEAPKNAKFLGKQNHIAKTEQKAMDSMHNPKAADLSSAKASQQAAVLQQIPKKSARIQDKQQRKGKENAYANKNRQKSQSSPQNPLTNHQGNKDLAKLKVPDLKGKTKFSNNSEKVTRNRYEQLLAATAPIMAQEIDRGYQQYIDDKIRAAKSIDLSTQEYRFIGYFTNMRKAIELAWVYPSQAVRQGLDGKVLVKFTIQRDGSVSGVEIKETSGHPVLDRAIQEAITMAAPFAPLPQSFAENFLDITGAFSYNIR